MRVVQTGCEQSQVYRVGGLEGVLLLAHHFPTSFIQTYLYR